VSGEPASRSERLTRGFYWGLALFLLTLVVRLIPAWFVGVEAADIEAYHSLGLSVLQGDNIYVHGLFHYSPYSQFLLAWAVRAADATGWRFDFVIKLPSIFADGATSVLLFAFLCRRGVPHPKPLLWSLAWALNPVTILSSAFHGNMMEMLSIFLLAAYVGFELESPDQDLLLPICGLLFGLGIALRPYPVLLLPIFLILRGGRRTLLFSVLALLPAALSSLPYLVYARETFLAGVVGYEGVSDFGWGAVLRGLTYVVHGVKVSSFSGEDADISQRLFLGAYAVFLLGLPLFKDFSLGRALLVPPLLFLALFINGSAQYLIWVLPVALALRDRMSLFYTAVATTAMICFYTIYKPYLLYGESEPLLPDNRIVAVAFTVANVALIVVAIVWISMILREEAPSLRGATERSGLARRLSPGWIRVYIALICVAAGAWLIQLARTARRAWDVVVATLSLQ